MENPRLSVIIPMYNETDILPTVLPQLEAYLASRFAGDFELIFVDDGSGDGSAEYIEKNKNEGTRVLRYTPNRGKGYAVRTGLLAARGLVRVFTDCDLAYGTYAIGEILTFLEAHPDHGGAIASRDLHPDGYRGYTLTRRLFSRVYRGVLRTFYGLKLSDSQSGLKAFTAAATEKIFPLCETDRYAFDFEAIMIGEKKGVQFCEMPACILANRPGKIHMIRDSIRMLRDLRAIKKRLKRIGKEN